MRYNKVYGIFLYSTYSGVYAKKLCAEEWYVFQYPKCLPWLCSLKQKNMDLRIFNLLAR